jgi:hypothetical protein
VAISNNFWRVIRFYLLALPPLLAGIIWSRSYFAKDSISYNWNYAYIGKCGTSSLTIDSSETHMTFLYGETDDFIYRSGFEFSSNPPSIDSVENEHTFCVRWLGIYFDNFNGTFNRVAVLRISEITLCVISGIPLFMYFGLRLTRKSQIPGHCIKCGYDLRASNDRCPECGMPIASHALKRSPGGSPPPAPAAQTR